MTVERNGKRIRFWMDPIAVSALYPVNNFCGSFKLPVFALSCGLNRLWKTVIAFWPVTGLVWPRLHQGADTKGAAAGVYTIDGNPSR